MKRIHSCSNVSGNGLSITTPAQTALQADVGNLLINGMVITWYMVHYSVPWYLKCVRRGLVHKKCFFYVCTYGLLKRGIVFSLANNGE